MSRDQTVLRYRAPLSPRMAAHLKAMIDEDTRPEPPLEVHVIGVCPACHSEVFQARNATRPDPGHLPQVRHLRGPGVTFGALSRYCPRCDVATHEDECWLCGQDLNRQEFKDRSEARPVNPAGPKPDAVGEGLIL